MSTWHNLLEFPGMSEGQPSEAAVPLGLESGMPRNGGFLDESILDIIGNDGFVCLLLTPKPFDPVRVFGNSQGPRHVGFKSIF